MFEKKITIWSYNPDFMDSNESDEKPKNSEHTEEYGHTTCWPNDEERNVQSKERSSSNLPKN